jgi:ribonucleoside-triphosphate reductase
MNAKNDTIVKFNQRIKVLNGGTLVKIQLDNKSKSLEIKKIIEDTASLISSFKPIKHVPICGNCGYKNEKLGDKCPTCKSTYII